MKKTLILVACLLISFLFVACGNGLEPTMKEVPQDRIIYNLSDDAYDYDKLTLYLGNNSNMTDFIDEFDVKYYKTFQEMYNYTVVNTNQGIVLVSFGKDGNYMDKRMISFSDEKCEEEIRALKEGISLTQVMKVDPDAHYDFLYAGWSEYPQVSYHYFSNGNCYAIKYDNEIIADIVFFTI